jgi:hypothetical protein
MEKTNVPPGEASLSWTVKLLALNCGGLFPRLVTVTISVSVAILSKCTYQTFTIITLSPTKLSDWAMFVDKVKESD